MNDSDETEVEGTLLLAAPSSAPAEVEGTLLLTPAPRGAADAKVADDMEATLFMTQRERVRDVAPSPEPIEATMMLPTAATADDGASATLALTMDSASFLPRYSASDVAERGGTSVVSQPALHTVAWAPETRSSVEAHRSPTVAPPQGYAPSQPAPFAPPGGDPRAVAPQSSSLGPLIAILALIAAVAGVAVGLLLGDG